MGGDHAPLGPRPICAHAAPEPVRPGCTPRQDRLVVVPHVAALCTRSQNCENVVMCPASASAPQSPKTHSRVLMSWVVSCLARCAIDALVGRSVGSPKETETGAQR